jgi:PKD repeat protein
VLSATVPGAYVLELTVANGRGSDTDTVTITIDAATDDPDTLTFVDDIRPLIARNGCTTCHAASGTDGIPGFWDDAVDSDSVPLYARLMARVDLAQPEDSKLLTKPSSVLHGGGKVIDPGTPAGEADYNILLNWIRAGAACGVNPTGLDLGCAE